MIRSIQSYYPQEQSYCYGCGYSNEYGLHLDSFWCEEDNAPYDAIAHYTPKPYETGGVPGNMYGGLLASIIDCHGNATAAAAAMLHSHRTMGTDPMYRCVTAHLSIDYVSPTSINHPLEIRAKVIEIDSTGRKVRMQLEVCSQDNVTVTAEMLSIRSRS